MSYLPNIQGLRFIERDGKKILQQWVYSPTKEAVAYTHHQYHWQDVPLEADTHEGRTGEGA